MQHVFFNNADATFRFPQKRKLKASIISLFNNEGICLKALNYVFCSDDYLLKINIDFLNHDYYTDIITFPLSSKGSPIEGEVYISIDRVKENAFANSSTMFDETLRVVFHGALHLCGYGDKTLRQAAIMRKKENDYISLFHVKQ